MKYTITQEDLDAMADAVDGWGDDDGDLWFRRSKPLAVKMYTQESLEYG